MESIVQDKACKKQFVKYAKISLIPQEKNEPHINTNFPKPDFGAYESLANSLQINGTKYYIKSGIGHSQATGQRQNTQIKGLGFLTKKECIDFVIKEGRLDWSTYYFTGHNNNNNETNNIKDTNNNTNITKNSNNNNNINNNFKKPQALLKTSNNKNEASFLNSDAKKSFWHGFATSHTSLQRAHEVNKTRRSSSSLNTRIPKMAIKPSSCTPPDNNEKTLNIPNSNTTFEQICQVSYSSLISNI
jgi:hypothetical protein